MGQSSFHTAGGLYCLAGRWSVSDNRAASPDPQWRGTVMLPRINHLGAALLLLFVAVGFVRAEPPTKDAAAPMGLRIFVCGHSFHVPIAGPLAYIAKSAGSPEHAPAGTQFLGGSRSIQHWNVPDEQNKAKQALRSGKVEVLTLSPHLQLPDEGIDKFTDLALEHNKNARVLVQASWYPYDAPGKNAKNFK